MVDTFLHSGSIDLEVVAADETHRSVPHDASALRRVRGDIHDDAAQFRRGFVLSAVGIQGDVDASSKGDGVPPRGMRRELTRI